MKTLYLDCGMGAAGDMLTAALLELLPDPRGFLDRLNAMGIPEVSFRADRVQKCGIEGTHVTVTFRGHSEGEELHHGEHPHDGRHHSEELHHHGDDHHHEHHHSGMADIEHIVRGHLNIPETVKNDIMNVYGIIADAESSVHGKPVTDIHFHEVGTMDAIADIAAVCLLMREISPDYIVASPVHTGSGHVRCAHGILPVPAPATALILKGIPTYGGSVSGELCTPTGAALLRYFADSFGDMPVMRTEAIGYGMGTKDFPIANCVRAMLGQSEDSTDTVSELSCNVDDMTAEELSFAMDRLFDGGAAEVYTVPVGMKKSRPGVLLRVMCRPELRDEMVRLIFKHTSTIGVRETVTRRFVLDREVLSTETSLGPVRVKRSSGHGVKRSKYEYEDLARIARERDLSLAEVRDLLDAQEFPHE